MKHIVLFGIQGSGKGTQAARMAEHYGAKVLGTGDMFRKLAAEQTPQAEEVCALIDAGKLLPRSLVTALVKDYFLELRQSARFVIFDGFPRTLEQLEDFKHMMEELGEEFCGLYLSLNKEEGLQRVGERFLLEGRGDDGDTTIVEKRMETFFADTLPVIAACREEGLLLEVNGSLPIPDVTEQIIAVLGKLNN